jgi:hypothetical protein
MGTRISAFGDWVRDHRGVVLALVLLVAVLAFWRLIEPTYSDVRGAPAGTCFAENPAVVSANKAGEVHLPEAAGPQALCHKTRTSRLRAPRNRPSTTAVR